MKILWITNTPIGLLGEKLYGKPSGGVWMSALLSDFEKAHEHQIVVATTASVSEAVKVTNEAGTVFYALPDSVPLVYNENKSGNIAAWKKLLSDEQPDLIQVWGTEFTHGLCALRVAGDIPSVIYMQGVLEAIARYYTAGIPNKELKKTVTFRDILKQDSVLRQQRKYYKRAEKEAEMLRLSGNFISENEWCNAHIKTIAPDAAPHECPLSINHVFAEYSWNLEAAERHSIMCTAPGYPLKGLHITLRALAILKKKYPDVKLYVPGEKQISDGSIQWLVRKRGYTKYIEKLIAELGVADNIVWLGALPQEKLAAQLSKCHVFALCSALENHSSSLKEAMMVGMPCVASNVGGIPEYVTHGENGLIYRFEEYEMLAYYISRIFDDNLLAQTLSEGAKRSARKLHDGADIYNKIIQIYQNILKKG